MDTLSKKADEHSEKVAEFVNTISRCAISAVIWTTALVVTTLTLAFDKVPGKFSKIKHEAADYNKEVTAGN
ncbi:MAG: hypothetical protein ACR5K2_04550 [Wolbachia sp.]